MQGNGERGEGPGPDRGTPEGGILAIAEALGRLMARRSIAARQELLEAIRSQALDRPPIAPARRSPRPGDQCELQGRRYRYDGTTSDTDQYTRLEAEAWKEALLSLDRRSGAALWMRTQLRPPPQEN